VSLSTSARTLAELIATSLALLRQDNPDGYGEMIRTSGDLRVNLRVGSEVCSIEFQPDLRIRHVETAIPDVEITSDRSSVAAVMSGELTLGVAIGKDILKVRGSLESVVRAHDTLMAYVRAAIQSPAQLRLQQRFSASDPDRAGGR
jgi:hypothetical protein